MRSNDKKDFGKKPVRRSKSEENEPARVYRPRTAKFNTNRVGHSNEEPNYEEREVRKNVRTEKESEKGYDKDTGYSRKGSKRSDRTRNDNRRSRFSGDDQQDEGRVSRSNVRKSSGKPNVFENKEVRKGSRRAEERDERKPRRGDEREKTYKGKKEYGENKFSKSRSYRNDDSYSTEKGDGKYSKSRSTRKVLSTRKKSSFDNDYSGYEKFDKQAPVIEADLKTDSEGYIRLNKYIANSGLCSRREADDYIQKGMITVNGEVVEQLGTKVKLTDEIRFRGKELDPEKKIYILLNKPKDYVTTVEDPNAKRTVMELIEGACEQRVYPVGRLDRNSTGLLLLTNDGELTKRLTHPSFMKKKIYEVGLNRSLDSSDMKQVLSGVDLEGEIVKADAIDYVDPSDLSVIGIEIHSGQNRVVRRIFENLGYSVQKLDRVYFAGLTKRNLPRGKWRFLTQKEVTMLKTNRF
ncbi:MAG TPA: pseudouridine synthase [Tenuifilaceae bacterium]|nr:pseudouridine synthase [Tenuifilaceae bacterium]HPE17873.1 pseudouridine synthase [Tenuifilaceae bacterium]HPJ45349.1 pseudouridine synthase [Tenuifilaceae bacterium]HPQ33590.1 pseudouridine synthase [Tenuifilaceae bacterium]HRX67396.1 pseudouridine synthase [Tenuifilaceae bacterium]